jgi:hypothetical protein
MLLCPRAATVVLVVRKGYLPIMEMMMGMLKIRMMLVEVMFLCHCNDIVAYSQSEISPVHGDQVNNEEHLCCSKPTSTCLMFHEPAIAFRPISGSREPF